MEPSSPTWQELDLTRLGPLSPAQEWFWRSEQLSANLVLNNVSCAQRILGPLDVGALERAILGVLESHEILRSIIVDLLGRPLLATLAMEEVRVRINLLTRTAHLPTEDFLTLFQERFPQESFEFDPLNSTIALERLPAAIVAEVYRPFDQRDIPFRAVLLKLGPEDHVLVLVAHHIAFDGASWPIFLGELGGRYQSLLSPPTGDARQTPPSRAQYSDFVGRFRELHTLKALQEGLDWWSKELANLPERLSLSPESPLPPRQSLKCSTETLELPAPLVSALRTFAQHHNVTLFEVMLTAYKTLLSGYAQREDLVMCVTYAGRTLPGTLELIGQFANVLAVRTRLDQDPTFLECLSRVRAACLSAYSALAVPFDLLVKHIRASVGYPEDLLGVPLSLLFSWAPPTTLTLPGLSVQPILIDKNVALADISLTVSESSTRGRAGLNLRADYAIEAFESHEILRLLTDLQGLLERVIRDPLLRLSSLGDPSQAPLPAPAAAGPRSIASVLKAAALATPEAPAILGPDLDPLRYRELLDVVQGVGPELQKLGLGRGDRIATLFADQGPLTAVTTLALAAHLAVVPLGPGMRSAEMRRYLSDLGVLAIIVSASNGSVEEVATELGLGVVQVTGELRRLRFSVIRPLADRTVTPEPDFAGPEEVALVLHTSGTTTRPKVVPLTHRNICAAAQSISETLQLSERDRCLNVMPLYHIHGFSALLSTLASGGTFVCWPAFHAPEFFEALEQWRPTWYTGSPAIHRSLLDRASTHADLIQRHPLRFVRSASGPMPVAWIAEMERCWGAPFVEAYGMTETAPQIASNPLPPLTRKPGSVGLPAGPQVAIMDPDGEALLAPGSVGEVVVRGENVFGGYEGDDRSAIAAGVGWFRTGDLGALDLDGYLSITGRCKDIINRGGEKIWPWEVDEVLRSHPAVAQAVTFPIPDRRLGEDVAAVVVLKAGAQVGEAVLQDHVASQLADFKVPRRILVADEIAISLTGKISRTKVAQAFAGQLAEMPALVDSMVPSVYPELEQKIQEIWKSVLGVTSVERHHNFFALGGDSMIAMRLIATYVEKFGIKITMNQIFREASTVAGTCLLIVRHQQSTKPQQQR